MAKKVFVVVVLVVLFANVVAWLFVSHGCGGALMVAEGAATRAKVDERCDAMEVKLDRIESKLGNIESKLDRLIMLATPSLPDGMKAAE